MEAQDQEESVESQPETVVEATPGRGNRRGKKNQSSTNNESEVRNFLCVKVARKPVCHLFYYLLKIK